MPPRKFKRRRAFIAPPSPETTPQRSPETTPQRLTEDEDGEPMQTLPDDLLLEIAARSDFTTLVRWAACCRALRREILAPAFIRRVCGGPGSPVPPCALGFLHAYDKARMVAARPPASFSAAHPATPGVAAFFEKHLARFVSGTAAADLLGDYEPLTSRNGLVVLRRRYLSSIRGRRRSEDICVYDPMSGYRTFLPSPPAITYRTASAYGADYTYVLLTAADGIGSSFLVLAADFNRHMATSADVMVQTASSDTAGGTWGPVALARNPRSRFSCLQPGCRAVVLRGSIHWLMCHALVLAHFHILTYDVRTATAGSIELPKDGVPVHCTASNLQLASSPDGRLSLHIADRLKISVWLLPPAGDGDGWSRHAVIDIAVTVRSLGPEGFPRSCWLKPAVDFASSGSRSGAMLLRPFKGWFNDNMAAKGEEALVVLDMETEKMRRVNKEKHVTIFPCEIDLEARLSAMKIF